MGNTPKMSLLVLAIALIHLFGIYSKATPPLVENDDCDLTFTVFWAEESLTVVCYLPQLQGEYPDLRTPLNNNRPIYDCVDETNHWYKLAHVDNGWRLERVEEDDSRLIIGRYRSWAVSPLTIATSTPKLDGVVKVGRCARQDSPDADAFHLKDLSSIQHSFTSFYVKIAFDGPANKSIYYGVSSRYFVWRNNDEWLFSAHSRNVGGSRFAKLKCSSTGQFEIAPSCVKADANGSYEPIAVEIVRSTVNIDVHQALIQARDVSRGPGKIPSVPIKNGLRIPLMGLGTGAMSDPATSIKAAFDFRYEFIDTATIYETEEIIGALIANQSTLEHGVPIIQTKVWPTELGYARTIRSIMNSRLKLRMPVIDLVLLHWPKCYREWQVDWMDCSTADEDEDGRLWLDSWRALERVYAEGFVLGIGVSNFDANLLRDAIELSISIPPMIVQNEFTLSRLDAEVVTLCREAGIVYQGYSFFRFPISDADRTIVKTAMSNENWTDLEDERTFLIQLLMRAHIVTLLRSDNVEHLKSNMEVTTKPLVVAQDVFDVFLSTRSISSEQSDVVSEEGDEGLTIETSQDEAQGERGEL